MKYRGREIDPVALWSEFVEFPANMDTSGTYLPLVVCPNPEHDTFKRHFQVNLEKPLVHCFAGCGISGTYENAIMLIEGVKRPEARKRILRHGRLAASPGKPHARKRNKRETAKAAEINLSNFSYIPQAGLEFLNSRGIDSASIAAAELGWNPETLRITIPVRDHHGRLKFVIERATRPKDFPKYLYPEDSRKSDVLYGACDIDLGMVRSFGIVLVEGSIDRIVLRQHGFTTVVAILGSLVSRKQAEIITNLRPKRVYNFFDRDTSGIGAMISSYERIPKTPHSVCLYPAGKNDPAEMSRKEASRSIERAISVGQFLRKTGLQARNNRQRSVNSLG